MLSHNKQFKQLKACMSIGKMQYNNKYDSDGEPKVVSHKEERVRAIANQYYAREDVQKAIFEFSKNREISPRYFEGFGKRPDILQYPGDVYALARKGATSFHCSEELWTDPLLIDTEMTPVKYNDIRIGWDLLIDIDCPWIDGSKYAAIAIVNVLKNHGINAISAKFSGSKGFHILVPFEAFPDEVAGERIKDLFPELPRKLVSYLRFKSGEELKKVMPEDLLADFAKKTNVKRGIKCNSCGEIAKEKIFAIMACPFCRVEQQGIFDETNKKMGKCPMCRKEFEKIEKQEFYVCEKCETNSRKNPSNFSKTEEIDLFEVMGLDLVLVSPRHLFRAPYSLHEKTALSSVVIDIDKIEDFDFNHAKPMEVEVKDFAPHVTKGEGKEFVMQALDWYQENGPKETVKKSTGKYENSKTIELLNVKIAQFPPCIKKILAGVEDGKKRALFALINLFRSIGIDKDVIQEKLYSWNEKNRPPLKKAYIKSQIDWTLKRKPIMPPNCKEFYQGIGVCDADNFCSSIKNPLNYVVRKNFATNKRAAKKKKK